MKDEERQVELTRENFAAIRAENQMAFIRASKHDFDAAKKSYLSGLDWGIKNLRSYIAEQQARHDGWKQTHSRHDGENWLEIWVKS